MAISRSGVRCRCSRQMSGTVSRKADSEAACAVVFFLGLPNGIFGGGPPNSGPRGREKIADVMYVRLLWSLPHRADLRQTKELTETLVGRTMREAGRSHVKSTRELFANLGDGVTNTNRQQFVAACINRIGQLAERGQFGSQPKNLRQVLAGLFSVCSSVVAVPTFSPVRCFQLFLQPLDFRSLRCCRSEMLAKHLFGLF